MTPIDEVVLSPKRALRGYALKDVCSMLGLSEAQVRGFVHDGLVRPRKGKRGEYRFSFQHIVLLRTAKELIDADIPTRRVKSALEHLREQLPSGRPLSGVQIFADGSQVVARQGGELWEPESGQTLFDFEVSDLAERAAPFAREAARAARDLAGDLGAEDWYELGCELEMTSPEDALDAYRRTLDLDEDHADAHLNLGRLLHEASRVEEALKHYRAALRVRPDDATAAFNLGVALQDLGRADAAVTAYEAAIDADPSYADAYFNLAGLHEKRGETALALKYLKSYRRLQQHTG